MVKVMLVGVGSLGEKIAAFLMERKDVKLMCAVDPLKAGQDLGVLATGKRSGFLVHRDIRTAVRKCRPDVAILATVSSIEALEPQIAQIARFRLPIVSTCEELSYPWKSHREASRRIDAICKGNKVACVGTGVNPGYLMDYLPVVLTSICQNVTKVEVERIQDARKRRLSFQKKIGTGLTVPEFRRLVRQGSIRHVGLTESMDMIAACLGWKNVRSTEIIRPVIAKKRIPAALCTVLPGQVCGVEQIGKAFAGGKEVIRLVFRASVAEKTSCDRVKITGTPSFESHIDGGMHGDVATCAVAINAVHSILSMPPGLWTMPQIPVPCFRKRQR